MQSHLKEKQCELEGKEAVIAETTKKLERLKRTETNNATQAEAQTLRITNLNLEIKEQEGQMADFKHIIEKL